MSSSVKSITVVRTSNGWAARQRNNDGSELFVWASTGYSRHQAEQVARNLSVYIERTGETYALPLPEGVKAVKQ